MEFNWWAEMAGVPDGSQDPRERGSKRVMDDITCMNAEGSYAEGAKGLASDIVMFAAFKLGLMNLRYVNVTDIVSRFQHFFNIHFAPAPIAL